MMDAWSSSGKCGPLMDQYGMQYSRTFANLCNAGVTVPMMQQALAPVCNVSPFSAASIQAQPAELATSTGPQVKLIPVSSGLAK